MAFEEIENTVEAYVPDGTYEARVASMIKKSGPNGAYYATTFEVINHPTMSGRKMTETLSLAEKARFRLIAFLKAVGAMDPKSSKGARVVFDAESLVGQWIVIKGTVSEKQGFERFRISSFQMHPKVLEMMPGATVAPASAPVPPSVLPPAPPPVVVAPPPVLSGPRPPLATAPSVGPGPSAPRPPALPRV